MGFIEKYEDIALLDDITYDAKCLIGCMLVKGGIIDEKGQIDSYTISLPNPGRCSNFTLEQDECEKTFLIAKCIEKELQLN